MAGRTCWYCKQVAHHTLEGTTVDHRIDNGYRIYGLMRCSQCGVASLAATKSDHRYPDSGREELRSDRANLKWWPTLAQSQTFPDVPELIAAAATEAHECFSIGAHRAALILARAVIEAAAKEKGATRGTLAAKIDALHEEGVIRGVIKDAAHDVRDSGNEMAHGDFVTDVTKEDAEEVLFLMGKVLDDVFQTPAMTAKRQAAKQARKSGEVTDVDVLGTQHI